jgi:uncharacterized membrane protein YqjE
MASAVGALGRIGAHALRLVTLRVALAADELDAARLQWLHWLALVLGFLALAALALLALGAGFAAAFWPQFGWPVLLIVAAVYALAAAWVLHRLVGEVRAAPPLLDLTRHELDKDLRVVRAGTVAVPVGELAHE